MKNDDVLYPTGECAYCGELKTLCYKYGPASDICADCFVESITDEEEEN